MFHVKQTASELMAVVILNAIVPRETQRRSERLRQDTLYNLSQ
jgi:hypothetical protein